MKNKAIGMVHDIGYNGKLIVKTKGEGKKEIGTKLSDRSGRIVGTITDLIGPVKAPYLIVAVSKGRKKEMIGLMGKDVYLAEEKDKNGVKNGRRRRREKG